MLVLELVDLQTSERRGWPDRNLESQLRVLSEVTVTIRVLTEVPAKVFTRYRSLVARAPASRSRVCRFDPYRGVAKS